jgi:hypothetical protein
VIRNLGIFLAVSLTLAADGPGVLKIEIVEGAEAVYPLDSRATRGVTVLISDESGRPVEGATVSFSLPAQGPGGVFTSGARTEIAQSGSRWPRQCLGNAVEPLAG